MAACLSAIYEASAVRFEKSAAFQLSSARCAAACFQLTLHAGMG